MSETSYERAGAVAVVTMTAPPNLFTPALGAQLVAAVRRARDEGVRALVLQADGPVFCGGADVSLFKDRSEADARTMLTEAYAAIRALEDAPFPVLAAVQGQCLAAGLEPALACDLVVAAEGTLFSQVEARIGAATFLGGANRLVERCGPARAREIVFGANSFDAATFERWNVVNRVVPAAELR
ncbi:enoyl-CoA hydratase/isomerase family protein [Amycolatopsis sp. FDAARGOS 1241]|uniref:enoyl-CoA hydratase/isomerase family protein n=1 Tax=Amycolatopsis sp. FDAARGOS 1241 TaxID=2778070 RepID=UPI001950D8E7|nr:enoyl-CoA hydratase/isomerase family protein [Amycolatopsis sp. FDAARGOS 1241]QRP43113.1 enoyl-CoA hydratase/isomerase family protein [Amycolatopsis sp. FDAARGOS 1241]